MSLRIRNYFLSCIKLGISSYFLLLFECWLNNVAYKYMRIVILQSDTQGATCGVPHKVRENFWKVREIIQELDLGSSCTEFCSHDKEQMFSP